MPNPRRRWAGSPLDVTDDPSTVDTAQLHVGDLDDRAARPRLQSPEVLSPPLAHVLDLAASSQFTMDLVSRVRERSSAGGRRLAAGQLQRDEARRARWGCDRAPARCRSCSPGGYGALEGVQTGFQSSGSVQVHGRTAAPLTWVNAPGEPA